LRFALDFDSIAFSSSPHLRIARALLVELAEWEPEELEEGADRQA